MSEHNAAPEEELAIESIGWLFIQKYYTTYTTRKAKLFALYDAHASVLHDAFPDTGNKVHQALGVDAIKSYFGSASDETAKIVVERADFQWAGANILIVVSGEWKRGGSPLWPFMQTFVLAAKEKTVYDVLNDVLRFVLSDVGGHAAPDVVPAVVPAVVPEVVREVVPEVAPEVAPPVAPEAAAPAEAAADAASENSKDSQADKCEDSGALASETSTANETTLTSEIRSDASDISETKTRETTATPEAETSAACGASDAAEAKRLGAKPTWATLAAIEPKVPKSAPAKAVAPPKKTPPPAPAAPVKFKREEWHPIYIRNIDVEEEELKSALVTVFGDIKYFKKSNRTALCDFRNKSDQIKALEAKEIVIGSNTISLEPRLIKPFKPEIKKDKKQIKKNGIKPKN